MRDISIPKEAPGSPFLQIFVSAGMFGAFASPVVAALVLAVIDHNLRNFGALVFWCGYFCLPAGLVCGALASIWLSLVALRNSRRTTLFLHGILAGITFGALLSLFVPQALLTGLSVIVGGVVGGAYAALFCPLLRRVQQRHSTY